MLVLERMRSLRNAENPGVSWCEEAEWIRLGLRWERPGPQSWAKGAPREDLGCCKWLEGSGF